MKNLHIMNEALTIKSKSDRIKLFFEILKSLDKKYSNALEAHHHLKNVFDQNEIDHLGTEMPGMSFAIFNAFCFLERFQVYRWTTNNHIIFIHLNGAYGIYYVCNMTIKHDPIGVYLTEKPLIKIPSSTGEDLWQTKMTA